MIRALISDFDDVILETAVQSARNACIALEQFKALSGTPSCDVPRLDYRVPKPEEFLANYGVNWRESILRLVPELKPHIDAFKMYYDSIKNQLPNYSLIQGAKGALINLRKELRSGVLGIMTARSKRSLISRSREVGLDLTTLNFYYAEEDLPYNKPHHGALFPVAKVLVSEGIQPHEAVYVGDMPTDFETVERFNQQLKVKMGFWGVRTGPRVNDLVAAVESHQTDGYNYHMLASITDVPTFLKDQNKPKPPC